MDFVGNRLDEMAQELGCDHFCGPLVQLDIGELARSIDGHEETELARGLHLGDVDMEVADRVVLEFRLIVAFDFGQAADPLALQAAMQG